MPLKASKLGRHEVDQIEWRDTSSRDILADWREVLSNFNDGDYGAIEVGELPERVAKVRASRAATILGFKLIWPLKMPKGKVVFHVKAFSSGRTRTNGSGTNGSSRSVSDTVAKAVDAVPPPAPRPAPRRASPPAAAVPSPRVTTKPPVPPAVVKPVRRSRAS